MAYFYISMYKYTSWSHWDYDYFCLNYEKKFVLICLLIEQICSLEYTADELKDRCQTLYKGSKKFMYVSFLFLDSLILLLVALPIRNAWIQFLSIIIFEINFIAQNPIKRDKKASFQWLKLQIQEGLSKISLSLSLSLYIYISIYIFIYLHILLYLYFFCRTALGEAYNGDNSFADSLEAFGCGQDDPISVSIGGSQCVLLFKLFNYNTSHLSCFFLITLNNFH